MSEIPLPERKPRHAPLEGQREHERLGLVVRDETEKPWTAGHGDLSVGAFHAEGRALVDARRGHLARLGMDPLHVAALRMPTTADEPLAVLGEPNVPMPVEAVEIEDQPLEGFLPKKLPKEMQEAL